MTARPLHLTVSHEIRTRASMRTLRSLFAILGLLLAFCAISCVQSSQDSQLAAVRNDLEPTEHAEPASTSPERLGEAEDPYTRADCYVAWKHNMSQCKTPECWFAVSLLLSACLKRAED